MDNSGFSSFLTGVVEDGNKRLNLQFLFTFLFVCLSVKIIVKFLRLYKNTDQSGAMSILYLNISKNT